MDGRGGMSPHDIVIALRSIPVSGILGFADGDIYVGKM